MPAAMIRRRPEDLADITKADEEITPSTDVSDVADAASFVTDDDDVESQFDDLDDDMEDDDEDPDGDDEGEESEAEAEEKEEEEEVPKQLQAGLYPSATGSTAGAPGTGAPPEVRRPPPVVAAACSSGHRPAAAAAPAPVTCQQGEHSFDETLFIFDWDDTILPSSWLQESGLRLDAGSKPTAAQREALTKISRVTVETLRQARRHGTVVLVTNAERGWIELSCAKFLPALCPLLENVKLVSARTTYECPERASPLDWKLRAFAVEIANHFGQEALTDATRRKNVLSLGDSMHEREALLVATDSLPNCSRKSLKFCERPDISQICKQHDLINGNFARIAHHPGNLDLCIQCP